MREMVQDARQLGCISQAQARGEVTRGLVQALAFAVPGPTRPIGLTQRAGWHPTPAQMALVQAIRELTQGPM